MNFPGNQNPQGSNSNGPNDDPALSSFLNKMSRGEESASDMARNMQIRAEQGEDLSGTGLNKSTRNFLLCIAGVVFAVLFAVMKSFSRIQREQQAEQDQQDERRRQKVREQLNEIR